MSFDLSSILSQHPFSVPHHPTSPYTTVRVYEYRSRDASHDFIGRGEEAGTERGVLDEVSYPITCTALSIYIPSTVFAGNEGQKHEWAGLRSRYVGIASHSIEP